MKIETERLRVDIYLEKIEDTDDPTKDIVLRGTFFYASDCITSVKQVSPMHVRESNIDIIAYLKGEIIVTLIRKYMAMCEGRR